MSTINSGGYSLGLTCVSLYNTMNPLEHDQEWILLKSTAILFAVATFIACGHACNFDSVEHMHMSLKLNYLDKISNDIIRIT